MGRRFNTRKGQTFFYFFYLLCLLFLSHSLHRQCSWYCIILLLHLLEMSWNMFPVSQICQTGSFRRGSNAEPGYEVWCSYLWTWRNNITSHFKIVTHLLVISKLSSQISWKVFRLVFFSYRRRNQPDWYCSSIFFVRRYKMLEIQPCKGIILHTKSLKKKRKMQFSILTQYCTAWWKMIPQEIFGKYVQTVSSYSVLNFPSH